MSIVCETDKSSCAASLLKKTFKNFGLVYFYLVNEERGGGNVGICA